MEIIACKDAGCLRQGFTQRRKARKNAEVLRGRLLDSKISLGVGLILTAKDAEQRKVAQRAAPTLAALWVPLRTLAPFAVPKKDCP